MRPGGKATLWALAALLTLSGPARAEPTESQRFFAERLIEDPGTAEHVRDLLGKGGFVDERVRFTDLTGDGRSDALVRVHSGGAEGVVAIYIFSTEGADELRAVFRSESLSRAVTRIRKGRVSYRYARYSPTDPICCPSRIGESRLRWQRKRERFVVAKRVQVHPKPDAGSR